jgi:hypothetical protein
MKVSRYIMLKALLVGAMMSTSFFWGEDLLVAQSDHQHQDRTMRSDKTAQSGQLLPAEGASVKILSPKKEQIFQSDRIPLQFRLVKGKRGHHVHAYVNGELMGMFNNQKGTLTGIKPGNYVLELRVVAEDHQSELDAIDRVSFAVK